MSNHAHLLIKSDLKELSMFMSKVLAKYAQYYNYKIIEMVMYFKTALEVNVLKVNGIFGIA